MPSAKSYQVRFKHGPASTSHCIGIGKSLSEFDMLRGYTCCSDPDSGYDRTSNTVLTLMPATQGRSPYEPPLRDENGNLILGPHSHDDDASGYVQQYDDRGHPCSKKTDTQNRRLRKAQNQVLKLAGVVRSQNDVPETDEWKTLDNEGKHQLITEENEGLSWLTRPFHDVVLDLSTCWVDALRFRFMVSCNTAFHFFTEAI
jgi:hypothetical protein